MIMEVARVGRRVKRGMGRTERCIVRCVGQKATEPFARNVVMQ